MATLKTTSVLGLAGVKIFYDKRFLRRADVTIVIAPLGQKRDLPKGTGKTIEFFRYDDIPISPIDSQLAEGVNSNETAVTGQKLSAVLSEYGNYSKHSSLLKNVHIDKDLKGLVGLWGDHAGRTIDLICQMEVASKGAYPFSADAGGPEVAGAFTRGTATAASTSTTVASNDLFTNTAFGGQIHDLTGAMIVITGGTGKGQARQITGYAVADPLGTATVAPAFDTTPDVTSTFIVASSGLLANGDVLSTTAVRRAVARLRMNGASPFEHGHYVGVLSPDTEADLMDDDTWQNTMSYKQRPDIKKTGGLYQGEVGMWGGVRWIRTNLPFRFPAHVIGAGADTADDGIGVMDPTAGTPVFTNYSATAAIESTIIFGKESFGVSTLKGLQGSILKPGIIIKTPGPQDTSNPLNMYMTIGWYIPFVAKALNPLFAIQIWSKVGTTA